MTKAEPYDQIARENLLKQAKPILFNTKMVRAILDGHKTQTRRLIKPQPQVCIYVGCGSETFKYDAIVQNMYCCDCGKSQHYYRQGRHFYKDGSRVQIDKSYCAPYQKDDILYVRETWATLSKTEGTVPQIYYKADDKWKETFSDFSWCIKWHPSIHMPKEAARIFLKVTDVRIERLQDMTLDDFLSEGAEPQPLTFNNIVHPYTPTDKYLAARQIFKSLWNSTIKKTDRYKYGWDANPHVWVIEFERVEV